MGASQQRIRNMSRKMTVILKLGFMVSNIVIFLAFIAIGILMFSGDEMKSSFLAAFNVTANNGTVISIAPHSLLIMFAFMAADTMLISFILFFLHAVFCDIREGHTPFSIQNTARIKKIAVIVMVFSIVGSYSDALVDYYTIGELTWKINIFGLIMGIIIYCLSLIFGYGCELQQESDETL